MKDKIVLAGAASIYGLNQVKKYFYQKGITVEMAETEYMSNYIEEKDLNCVKITDNIAASSDLIVIPLNEYWVSYLYRNPSLARISRAAFKASRSKRYLSELLQRNLLSYNKYFPVNKAVDLIVNYNKRILLKPDCLYSGHGIKIISKDNLEMLETYFDRLKQVKDEVKEVLNITHTVPVLWEYLEGTEYSADIFFCKGSIKIIRLCRKYIEIIDDAPCVLAYVTVPVTDAVGNAVESWMHVIYSKDDIAFAQLDFIITEDENKIIPIDYSCRVGGGLVEMFKKSDANIYLEALKALEQQENFFYPEPGLYQFNILPLIQGTVVNDDYGNFKGEITKLKTTGDSVYGTGPSTNNRLAVVTGKDFDEEYFEEIRSNLLIGKEYIKN